MTIRGFEDVVRALPTAIGRSERVIEGVFNLRARVRGQRRRLRHDRRGRLARDDPALDAATTAASATATYCSSMPASRATTSTPPTSRERCRSRGGSPGPSARSTSSCSPPSRRASTRSDRVPSSSHRTPRRSASWPRACPPRDPLGRRRTRRCAPSCPCTPLHAARRLAHARDRRPRLRAREGDTTTSRVSWRSATSSPSSRASTSSRRPDGARAVPRHRRAHRRRRPRDARRLPGALRGAAARPRRDRGLDGRARPVRPRASASSPSSERSTATERRRDAAAPARRRRCEPAARRRAAEVSRDPRVEVAAPAARARRVAARPSAPRRARARRGPPARGGSRSGEPPQQGGRHGERRVRDDAERPRREQEVRGVGATTVTGSIPGKRSAARRARSRCSSIATTLRRRRDQRRGDRSGARADVEHEVARLDLRGRDEARRPRRYRVGGTPTAAGRPRRTAMHIVMPHVA